MNIFITTAMTPILDQGILVPDKDGYYTSVVGALNIANTSGDFYVFNNEVAKLFDQAGALNRRASNNRLRGEVEHPDWPEGMSEDAYAARMLFIDGRNVCVHFAGFVVRPSANNRNQDGTVVYDVVGKWKPTGTKMIALKSAVENPKENVCFSLRGFTYDEMVGGRKIRILAEPITYDFVNDPGIPVATSHFNPAQKLNLANESAFGKARVARECHKVGRALTENGVRRALEHMHQVNPQFACECAFTNVDNLFQTFGWKKPSTLGFANWK